MLKRDKRKTALKSWGEKITKRCHKKEVVAMTRKLAVITHAMCPDRTVYGDRQHGEDIFDDVPTGKDRKLLVPRHDARRAIQPQVGARPSASPRSALVDEDRCRPWTTGSTISCLRPERSWATIECL